MIFTAVSVGFSVVPLFQDSLHALMATLSASNPFFVRCIKPNMDKVGPEDSHDITLS